MRTEEAVMRKVAVIGVMAAVLLAANLVRAGMCEIINGSFEDDGRIDDIVANEPNGWSANVPAGKFKGYVFRDWTTDGIYNLTLYSQRADFVAGDTATVSQELYLADVNEIVFDLKLDTDFSEWDPNVCAAVVLIDDDVVWQLDNVGQDVRGEYFYQTYIVEDKYRDEKPHKLSLGLKANVDEMLWERYYTYWDSITCTVFCGGGGLLPGDLNRDCFVDMNDLMSVAGMWLDEVEPYNRQNLFRGDDITGYGVINFSDFAILSDEWYGNVTSLGMFADRWLEEVELDYEYNLFRQDDVNPSGMVNFLDLAILADNWLGSSFKEELQQDTDQQ
jgi:hypothetical protein